MARVFVTPEGGERNEIFHARPGNAWNDQALSLNGEPVPYDMTGLKDVFLVQGVAEILVRLDHEATDAVPFMLHCHILEHEDAGMMRSYLVT